MKDNRVSNKKILVARDNKICREICEWMQYMLEDKKSDRSTSREVDGK